MSDAKTANQAALRQIEMAKAAGATDLRLDDTAFHALEDIPPQVAGIEGLKALDLDNTQVSDLSPLAGMTALQTLFLSQTQVSDLSPLAGMTALQDLFLIKTKVRDLSPLAGMTALQRLRLSWTQVSDLSPLARMTVLQGLYLDQTQVSDLRPIRDLPELANVTFGGLWFTNTPAALSSPDLTRLSQIKDDKERTSQTLAYLKTLPPYPEPLPWDKPEPAESGTGQGEPAQTAQSHIAFLLEHAATTKISAATTAAQIRFALREVPASDGNKLPPVLETMLDVATVLDQLAKAPIDPGDPDRERDLNTRIAALEAQIKELTKRLADETQAKEAAEALAKTNGFWSNYKVSTGKAAGVGSIALVSVSVPPALIYFLGVGHPVIQAYLTALGRLP